MLQVIQYQRTGKMSIEDLPAPQVYEGGILVRNMFSVLSSGTERTSVETARASLIGKARSRPDLVKQVIGNARREGVRATYTKVKNRLDNYKELGYSSAGIVLESSVPQFKPGDRVACAGDAHHAEVVVIPKHLAARIPDTVSFEEAAFATVSAIALQGVRQANVRIGETVAVIGLGLIGLIVVQLLKANGCRVVGLDIAHENFGIARTMGCDLCLQSRRDAKKSVESFTRGYGTDAVIITAGTSSSEPVELACEFSRKKSTVVIVGAVGMDIPRSPFYEKELALTIACSYGPGRYDASYEYQGADYPLGYVRWTENRNMEAVLELMSRGALDVKALVTHRFTIQRGLEAYDLITGKNKTHSVGILLEYPDSSPRGRISAYPGRVTVDPSARISPGKPGPAVAFIGAGNFAQSYLLPPLKQLNVQLRGVAVSTPVNARSVADKFGFAYCATDPDEILNDKETNTVFIATWHDSHARFVIEALKRGKHVFVEKPLAVTREQLLEISRAYKSHSDGKIALMAGFNRRFSRPFQDIQDFFSAVPTPLVVMYRVNAGELPANHWIYRPGQGGRILGEACHFIDCMAFLTNASPTRVFAESPAASTALAGARDSVSVTIRFSNGSVGNLLYLTAGEPSMGKEYCEVFGGGATAVMNNFKDVVLWRSGKRKRITYGGDKGHAEEVRHFIDITTGAQQPRLSVQSILETSNATFAIEESLLRGMPIDL
jgi:predicted dehydrogenase/threonine dehydrogenase-like Zn-dependent dehydrogenase